MPVQAEHAPLTGAQSKPIEIVAALLTHRGRLGLFRRSQYVTGDAGCWHCITGFLPQGAAPLRHALVEVLEELGIEERALCRVGKKVIDMADASGQQWRVHAFHFESSTDRIQLNWENDDACWVSFDQIHALRIVHWLPRVVSELSGIGYPTRPGAPIIGIPT
ncbi:NUDIX domain-containing protein [Pseudomonas typographi]|uniref:NUDIX domain-containing protein n=1 Tax=Pseudomonas typographi TaxID=2715964 RepID=A0ABR7Z1M8_9PSED|nr:NUDIX domain-containing protein [Pseudomonas typographi]MBD1551501.1 NUDIX domain-containing protein [Pseudomonas typographi]MBD1599404.1 NUDIX domain-containing protein [Pseudomonas typographi]